MAPGPQGGCAHFAGSPDGTAGRRTMLIVRLLVFLISAIFFASRVWAHGVVGDYTFIEPLVAEDANPKNEFVIARPQWHRGADGREFNLRFSIEKVLLHDHDGALPVSLEIGDGCCGL